MALSKERKEDLVAQYEAWLKESNGLILAEYTGLNMPQMDDLRAQAREKGAEFHVIKNRLGKRVFEAAGIEVPDDLFKGSTAFGVAFEETPGIAKVLKDFGKDRPALKAAVAAIVVVTKRRLVMRCTIMRVPDERRGLWRMPNDECLMTNAAGPQPKR